MLLRHLHLWNRFVVELVFDTQASSFDQVLFRSLARSVSPAPFSLPARIPLAPHELGRMAWLSQCECQRKTSKTNQWVRYVADAAHHRELEHLVVVLRNAFSLSLSLSLSWSRITELDQREMLLKTRACIGVGYLHGDTNNAKQAHGTARTARALLSLVGMRAEKGTVRGEGEGGTGGGVWGWGKRQRGACEVHEVHVCAPQGLDCWQLRSLHIVMHDTHCRAP